MSRKTTARALALLGLFSSSLGCASSGGQDGSVARTASPAEAQQEDDDRSILRPDEIFDILEQSPILYEIKYDDSVSGRSLAEVIELPVRRSRSVDEFVSLTDGDGNPGLTSLRPPAEVAELYLRAQEAFGSRDYAEAGRLYAEAQERAPEYFKTYTYLGRSLHLIGEHRAAEAALSRALELNPVDYQALMYLGDTYFELGRYDEAKAALVRAFLLNRSDEVVQERLSATLAKLDEQVRGRWLLPQFRIARTDEAAVEMRFHDERSNRWLALAACLACWSYEDACRERVSEDDDPLRLAMYRECLINQAASIAIRRDVGEQPIPTDEQVLLSAIEAGYLEAIIFWEVVADVAPLVIYLLPEEVKADIQKYIERFVIVSTRVV